MKPTQLALFSPGLTPSERETLRRYGALEVRGVRQVRTARERAAHEKRKNAAIPKMVAAVRLRRMT